jgi:pilus assembly protein Flp/PilA
MLRSLFEDCEGQDMVEYTLLAAVVALGCVAALSSFQNTISTVWNQISNNLAAGS